MNRDGVKWNREETILAFDLYCRTPFGKIGSSNPDVVELAALLGRTTGSIGLKMQNLAHLDPELQKRNVRAMAHGSKLDKEIFFEFSNNWTELSYQAQMIKARLQKKNIDEVVCMDDIKEIPAGEYRERMMKVRIGQYFFRMTVLNSYNNRCCVTGLNEKKLLVASHIKPWNVCNEENERTNPKNGLCLNFLHDKAFDKGLITISKDYTIIISNKMKDALMDERTKRWFMGYDHSQIRLPDKFLPGIEFIEYHNDLVFQG